MAVYLKQIRLSQNMTQNELAKKVNLNRATISMIEIGLRKGSVTTWDKIEAILNVPQQELRKMEKESGNE
jgi:transcriptional regulator with XRE-family HTH domain